MAIQTDYTRVITCALGDESDGIKGTTYNRTLDEFGIDKSQFAGKVDPKHYDWGHHKCSHDPKPTLPQIKRTWEECQAAAIEFDRLGFDSAWVCDHVYGVPNPTLPILEAWSLLAAVGAVTENIELGRVQTA